MSASPDPFVLKNAIVSMTPPPPYSFSLRPILQLAGPGGAPLTNGHLTPHSVSRPTSEASVQKVKNLPYVHRTTNVCTSPDIRFSGYKTPVFSGKEEQRL